MEVQKISLPAIESDKYMRIITNKDKKWLDQELSGCKFKDKRLEKRFKLLCSQLWHGIGEPIPFACQDWANTKAAYRFFSNERIAENELLEGHFESTKERALKTEGLILILQDTTEFCYERDKPELIGLTHAIPNGRTLLGKLERHTKCGILMHSSLAITREGLPLGVTALKFWTRKKFKGCNELKKHVNSTRMPIEEKESYCWLENLKQSTRLLNEPSRCVHWRSRK